jgi:hypothetical protein
VYSPLSMKLSKELRLLVLPMVRQAQAKHLR